MSDRPLLSIVTPCYNAARTIRDTLESVARQQNASWEHIVVDGGSTDGTPDIVREYSHVRWISEKDQGHYHAMNKGHEMAKGDFVCVLNADDCFREDALSGVSSALEKHPEWDGLFGDAIFVDDQGREIYRRREVCFDYDVLRFSLGYVLHPTFFLRRSLFAELGGFRYRELKNSADYDLILRVARLGKPIGHVPRFLVDYRIHDFGQSADMRIQKNMTKESRLLMREHGKPEGAAGLFLSVVFRLKRQFQKLGHGYLPDLVPGSVRLRKHMRKQTTFSSNIDLDKLS